MSKGSPKDSRKALNQMMRVSKDLELVRPRIINNPVIDIRKYVVCPQNYDPRYLSTEELQNSITNFAIRSGCDYELGDFSWTDIIVFGVLTYVSPGVYVAIIQDDGDVYPFLEVLDLYTDKSKFRYCSILEVVTDVRKCRKLATELRKKTVIPLEQLEEAAEVYQVDFDINKAA